jgi:hypothetical protein
MNIFPTSCDPNPQPFSIKDILQEQAELPNIETLVTVCSLLGKISKFDSQSDITTVAFLIQRISSYGVLTPAHNQQLKPTLKKVFCNRCGQYPIQISIFPHKFCEQCHKTLRESDRPMCYNCFSIYNNDKYRVNCSHLCIFCANLWLQRGLQYCPVCGPSVPNPSYLEFLNTELECRKCSRKDALRNNFMLRLSCAHIMCESCLHSCIQNNMCIYSRACIFQKDYSIFYTTEVCEICSQRKTRKHFVWKNCCGDFICKRCQAGRPNCVNCGILK